MAAPPTPPASFALNERVLCYHGPLIYEAKILRSAHWDDASTKTGAVGPHFFVHYKGWKQTWDEWVHPRRLLKLTETNVELQRTLALANAAALGPAAGAGAGGSAVGSAGGAGAHGKGVGCVHFSNRTVCVVLINCYSRV